MWQLSSNSVDRKKSTIRLASIRQSQISAPKEGKVYNRNSPPALHRRAVDGLFAVRLISLDKDAGVLAPAHIEVQRLAQVAELKVV